MYKWEKFSNKNFSYSASSSAQVSFFFLFTFYLLLLLLVQESAISRNPLFFILSIYWDVIILSIPENLLGQGHGPPTTSCEILSFFKYVSYLSSVLFSEFKLSLLYILDKKIHFFSMSQCCSFSKWVLFFNHGMGFFFHEATVTCLPPISFQSFNDNSSSTLRIFFPFSFVHNYFIQWHFKIKPLFA